jgi:class 3 adenylate cyclase/tetratricopeptide (TPR) repeat protein
MICSSCSTENRPGRRFCSACGSPLTVSCPSCGAANEPGDRFCGECGFQLEAAASTSPASETRAAPQSERRLVSVLFADLVGFTPFSEERDAEEVRELLSRYFEMSRDLISRYGGTVEKFIGDAVMAVWGAPAAKEDDAERAVRAALDLVTGVRSLGEEVGTRDLQARVGVLTGEAAVTLGAQGEGMVAGDLVNTASRIQSAAPPGAVLVGEGTRRASEAAIAYADAGSHELKGKEEPVSLWRAARVVAGRGGALRPTVIEAPFSGRDREMHLVKELFHASASEGKAHLVSVVGVAGVGKTRLSWEFEKYIDGLVEDIWWHRGRCLAYGEGVAYWALAEMLRGRAGIVEGEDPETALPKLRRMVEEHLADPEERRWVEPRLAHLIGLEERTAPDQADLFSAWRLFFERMAEESPLEMIFEDLQWADAALLDFIEYLLEWSKDHPIFILTLARPEITDRRPSWGAGRRNFTSLSLEPLSPEAMENMMQGLVPGLPAELQSRILDRAQGIPLYAVETVRMLIDRGLLARQNGGYSPTGPIELDVPETLHALIAARLDGLGPEERRLLQNASVLGKTFTAPAVAAVFGMSQAAVDPLLQSLVRKDFLSIQSDPRSPERGQYGFLQDLVRKVAYDTLSKKERKALHLAQADYLESTWSGDEDEIVEVLASHLLEAYRADPKAPDASEVKARARAKLAAAGDRVAGLAATEEAQAHYEQAAELTDDPVERAELLERTGLMAWAGGRDVPASAHLERAIALMEAEGRSHDAARVAARLAEITWAGGHIEQAVESMERSFEVLQNDEPDEGLASLAAQLGRLHYFMGHVDLAAERLEQALEIAESLWLPEVLSQALNSKGTLILTSARGRPHEGITLLRHSLGIATEADVPSAALRAQYNLSNMLYYRDQLEESVRIARDGLALARRRGDRNWEWAFLALLVGELFMTGEWDEALDLAASVPHMEESASTRFAAIELLIVIPPLHIARGAHQEAAEILERYSALEDSEDVQERAAFFSSQSTVLRAAGDSAGSLEAAREAIRAWTTVGPSHQSVKLAFVEAGEAALALGDISAVEDLLSFVGGLSAGRTDPFLRAQASRFRARLDASRDDADAAEAAFVEAERIGRDIGAPFWLGVVLLEHAEWLGAQERSDAAAGKLAEARGIFEGLEAKPWLDRVDEVEAGKGRPSSDQTRA